MQHTFHLRFTIAVKLILWCLVLIAIFYAVTIYLFIKIQNVVTYSSNIVNVHSEIADTSDQMIQRLIALTEHRKRFEILGTEEYREYTLSDAAAYGQLLERILTRHPDRVEPWTSLYRHYKDSLAAMDEQGLPAVDDIRVNAWTEILLERRDHHRAEMQKRLVALYNKGREAERMGFVGLSAAMAVGLIGSALIAWLINRSLSELRHGIRSFTREGRLEHVRVLSHDELGELAGAFNQMTDRLRWEEQMRSDFISMLSHEIRTPLTSIRESVKLVRDGVLGPVSERQQRFMDISAKEVDRLTNLLSRLMQVSSLESRELVLDSAPMKAGELVTSTVERMLPTAEAKRISMETTLPGEDIEIVADVEHVRQVLVNLLGNAIKFSSAGSRVRIEVARDDETPGREGGVRFCVTDQGPGIPEQERPYVFQKYYRSSAVKNSVDGVGLGLSISKHIIESHGGRMWVRTKSGKGSRFCFCLPAVPPAPAEKNTTRPDNVRPDTET